jgi:hypothetical protein
MRLSFFAAATAVLSLAYLFAYHCPFITANEELDFSDEKLDFSDEELDFSDEELDFLDDDVSLTRNNVAKVIEVLSKDNFVLEDRETLVVSIFDDSGAVVFVGPLIQIASLATHSPFVVAFQTLKNVGRTTNKNTPIEIDVLTNDLNVEDGDIITSVSKPDFGTAVINLDGKGITYTPDDGFLGTASFTYEVEEAGADWHGKRRALSGVGHRKLTPGGNCTITVTAPPAPNANFVSPTQAVALVTQSVKGLALPGVGLNINTVLAPVLNAKALSTNAANQAVGATGNANFVFGGAGNGFRPDPFAPPIVFSANTAGTGANNFAANIAAAPGGFQTPATGVSGNFIGPVPSATGLKDFTAATGGAGSLLGFDTLLVRTVP